LVRADLIKNRQLYRQGGKTLVRNDQRIPEISQHWTEIKIDEAIRTIADAQAAQKPFLLNLWFDVPHTPYEPAPEPHLSRYQEMGIEGDQLLFRSMVSHLDAQIGRLLQHLKQKALLDNTIILFTSDNGPAYQGSPGPFKGGKTDLHEGGIRVPMFVVWPGQIPADTYSWQTMHMADLFPTFAALTSGGEVPDDLDGMDLSGHWLREEAIDRGMLFWQMDLYTHFQNQGPKPQPYATTVAMDGHWKLLADTTAPTELFDLSQDHRELYDLLDEQRLEAKRLQEALRQFWEAPRLGVD
ncbi:MAG: sulfatase-like hydrolase/transferase, partial [Bacteroidota bacterium]